MADNTTLPTGIGGDTIATDDIGGVKFQRIKLIHGADGTNAGDVAAANALPIYKPNRSATGSLTALNSAVSLVLDGDGDVSMDIAVTALVGTIIFEQRVPGGSWWPTNATVAGTSGPASSYVNPASGLYRLTSGGAGEVRVRVSAFTSGSAAVIIASSASSNGIYANQILPTKTYENSTVSTANSTAVNLAGAAVFTGTSEDISEYSTIMVSIFSSHASATDGLSMQQSMDGTNWDLSDAYTIPAATGKTFNVAVSCKFYRLVYTNGATLTTSLRIQTIHSKAVKRSSSVRVQDARSNENDFDEVASYGQLFNGASWDRQRGMSLALTTGDTGAKTATGQGAAQTNIGNKGVQIVVQLGAVSGTTPTCVFKVQDSADGGTTWVDVPGAASASITATGNFGIKIYPGIVVTAGTTTSNTTAGANQVLGRTWRLVWTIGGTTPSFAITAVQYTYLVN